MFGELELRVGCPGDPLCVGIFTVQIELVLTVDTFAQFGGYATSMGHSKQEVHCLAKLGEEGEIRGAIGKRMLNNSYQFLWVFYKQVLVVRKGGPVFVARPHLHTKESLLVTLVIRDCQLLLKLNLNV